MVAIRDTCAYAFLPCTKKSRKLLLLFLMMMLMLMMMGERRGKEETNKIGKKSAQEIGSDDRSADAVSAAAGRAD